MRRLKREGNTTDRRVVEESGVTLPSPYLVASNEKDVCVRGGERAGEGEGAPCESEGGGGSVRYAPVGDELG